MIKFMGNDPKTMTPVYGLGLTEANIEKLIEGKPIKVNLADMNPTARGSVLIFYGVDERSMYQDLKFMIGPDTKIKDQDRSTEHIEK